MQIAENRISINLVIYRHPVMQYITNMVNRLVEWLNELAHIWPTGFSTLGPTGLSMLKLNVFVVSTLGPNVLTVVCVGPMKYFILVLGCFLILCDNQMSVYTYQNLLALQHPSSAQVALGQKNGRLASLRL